MRPSQPTDNDPTTAMLEGGPALVTSATLDAAKFSAYFHHCPARLGDQMRGRIWGTSYAPKIIHHHSGWGIRNPEGVTICVMCQWPTSGGGRGQSTIIAKRFVSSGRAPVFTIPGRTYPVELLYTKQPSVRRCLSDSPPGFPSGPPSTSLLALVVVFLRNHTMAIHRDFV